MHHALLLPDIFRRILDFLEIIPNGDFYATYQEGREHNLYIARLAQTCTTFLEPCLDALWKHQRTLGPLVKTLPSDAYEEQPRRYRGLVSGPRYFVFDIIRPLCKTDWFRFDYYASRIKALGYYGNEYADQEGVSWNLPSEVFRLYELSPGFLTQLFLYRGNRWLLPNLTRLRWNIYDAPYTDHLPQFLGPNLTSLAFSLQPQCLEPQEVASEVQEQISRILDDLAELCPNITELEMYPEYSSNVVVAAHKFAYQCNKLEGYHVNTTEHAPFDWDFLLSLAAKPHLRKAFISLDTNTADLLPLLSSPPVYHPFPALQVLYLKVYHLHYCTPLFPAMQHCRLFSLIIEVESQPLASDVIDLYDALHKHCAKNTLHVLRLTQHFLSFEGDNFPPPKSGYLIDIAVLSPILHFPNIRVFVLHIPLFGWLTDEDFRDIGDAWPGLVYFSFLETWGTPAITPGTWEGVVSLVQRCPLLTELHLLFDATRNLHAALKLDGHPHTQLRYFNVVDSALPEDPGAFAQALFAIAPRIGYIGLSGPWEMEAAQDGPLAFDPYTYREQVDKIMCEMRRERFGSQYTTDIIGAKEIADAVDSQPKEWNPWA